MSFPSFAGAAKAAESAMSTATLSNAPATQLTFPWVVPKGEVASITSDSITSNSATSDSAKANSQDIAAAANSVRSALSDDRIGKPIRIGAVMFRLLKRYGISDAEIAEGLAAYTAKHAVPAP